MSKFRTITYTGLAMFAMFFGSGNLVFPLKIGIQTPNHYWMSSLGLILTGVIVPFLGLFGMILYGGDRKQYFGLLGSWAPFILSLFMLSLLGPFGVVPRCILVAFGGINILWPDISFVMFSFWFSSAIFLTIWQKNKFIPLVGKWLAPLKFNGIVIIIVVSIINAPTIINLSDHAAPFKLGLMEGYQTMDLLAAFFFSITIIEYLKSICSTENEAIKTSFAASVIGSSLIAFLYVGLVVLGAFYSSQLKHIKPEQYLATISNLTLGKHATLILALTMCLACLTTAASLSRLFAEFLQKDVFKNKISWSWASILTVVIAFLLSFIGFTNISKVLGIILEFFYPALIMFTLTSILNKYSSFRHIKKTFWATVAITLTYKLGVY